MMRFRHLDYPESTPVEELGPAALEALLDRGDLESWVPLAQAIRRDPRGPLADRVLSLLEAHPLYGTSALWRAWIEDLRERPARAPDTASSLSGLRRRRGLTQQELGELMGITQSDVSKLERRSDLRLSTLESYVHATGGRLALTAHYPDEVLDIELPRSARKTEKRT
jgi:hypothetical protein